MRVETEDLPKSEQRNTSYDGRCTSWVEINLSNLLHNAQTISAVSWPARLMAVVKADAYGLGAVQVARALESVDPWGYAVATVEEGAVLREGGFDRPILVLRPARDCMQQCYRNYRLTAVIDDAILAGAWTEPFHVEIDTGMGRTGVRWDASEALASIATRSPEGAFTHFHSADTCHESVVLQWGRFQQGLAAMVPRPFLVHAANSAAVWEKGMPLNLVRPGIFLYGGCARTGAPRPLPVVSVKTTVVSVRKVHAGDSVGYGADWRATKSTWIATLAIGYADGVLRGWAQHGKVLLHGHRCPVAGRVNMDMITVDAGDGQRNAPRVGDVATLIGSDGLEAISLDEHAGWANTISYEVLTRLGRRLPRVYLGA